MDAPSRLTLRIFISSPGDVPVERDRAADVIARLQEEFVHYAVLEPFFWEDQPSLATETFQLQFPEASAMDIVVGILWARIGTPLPVERARPDGGRYESGTVYELETAAEAYRSRGTPDLVVYRRTSDPPLPLHDEAERQRRLEQLESLESFIKRWFFHDDGSFKAAFHTFKTPDRFEQQLETHLRKLIREKVEKAEQPGGPAEGEIVFHGVPYPGLRVFGLEDAPVFYGRSRALVAVKEALRTQAGRNCAFLLIFGMSGSGKSSLVRAGLVHAVISTPGWIEGVDAWRWCLVRPGDATGDAIDALAQAFFGDTALPELRAGGIDAPRLARTLRENPDDVDLIVRPALRAVADSERARRAADCPLTARLLVVVDQMEELFTRDRLDESGRGRYVAALAALARSGMASVVATMRSEFFARCGELPELVALKDGQGQLDLLPPTFAEIGQLIRYPARDAALRWGKDPDHPGQALDDVLQEAAWRDPKALPLLQFTLNELFRRRDGRTLTCAAYRALGGMEGALANHAEATLAALPPDVQAALPALLRSLVTAGEGEHEPVVSRRVPLDPLRGDPIRRQLLDVLIDARLLLTDRDDQMQPVAGIAHEALLTHWPRLKDLLDKDREFLRARMRVVAAADRWRREKRHVDFLLHEGKPLAEARELLEGRREDLEPETREFIEQSIRRARRNRRLKQVAVAGLAVLTLLSVGFAVVAFRLATVNETLAGEEKKARRVAEERLENIKHGAYNLQLGRVRDLVVRDRVAASHLLDDVEAFPMALRDFTWGYYRKLIPPLRKPIEVGTYPVLGVAFSPDGKAIATAGADHTVKIWNLADDKLLTTYRGHQEPVLSVAFSPDGKSLASADRLAVRLWGSRQGVLKGDVGSNVCVCFAPEGETLATAGSDRVIRIWDLKTSRPRAKLVGHVDTVRSLTFSPDGRLLASASDDKTVRLWEVSNGRERSTLTGHKAMIRSLSFSSRGTSLASADVEGDIRVWDIATGRLQSELAGPGRASETFVSFVPDREILVAAANPPGISAWELSRDHPTQLVEARDLFPTRILGVGISPDGGMIATPRDNGCVTFQDPRTGHMSRRPLDAHAPSIQSSLLLPGNGPLVLLLSDGTIEFRDPATASRRPLLMNPEGTVKGIFCTSDGRTLLSYEGPDALRVWDVATGRERAVIRGPKNLVRTARLSPDGRMIAVVLPEGSIELRDLASGEVRTRLRGEPDGEVGSLTFTPDGKMLASLGRNKIRLWDVSTGAPQHVLVNPDSRARSSSGDSVVFSPDGKTVAGPGVSSSSGTTVRLWDVATGRERIALRLKSRSSRPTVRLFSPDGRTLATRNDDSMGERSEVRIWDVETGRDRATIKLEEAGAQIVGFTRDGNTLILADDSGKIGLFDLASAQVRATLAGHPASYGLLHITLSPDGRTIASSGVDSGIDVEVSIRIWDVATGTQLAEYSGIGGHEISFSADSRTLFATEFGAVSVLDAFVSPGWITRKGHIGEVNCLAFSPDGRTLASAGVDSTIKFWDVETQVERTALIGSSDEIRRLAFSPDGQTLACAGEEKTIRLWDPKTGRERAALVGHDAPVWHLLFTRDGRTLVSVDRHTVILWDIAAGRPRAKAQAQQAEILGAALAEDDKTLATAGADGTIRLRDVASGIEQRIFIKQEKTIDYLASTPDGTMLAWEDTDSILHLSEVATGRERAVLKQTSDQYQESVFSPDGRTLASLSLDRTIHLWDALTGQERAVLRGPGVIASAAAFSPDGRTLASAGSEGTITFWLTTGSPASGGRAAGLPGVGEGSTSPNGVRPDSDGGIPTD